MIFPVVWKIFFFNDYNCNYTCHLCDKLFVSTLVEIFFFRFSLELSSLLEWFLQISVGLTVHKTWYNSNLGRTYCPQDLIWFFQSFGIFSSLFQWIWLFQTFGRISSLFQWIFPRSQILFYRIILLFQWSFWIFVCRVVLTTFPWNLCSKSSLESVLNLCWT